MYEAVEVQVPEQRIAVDSPRFLLHIITDRPHFFLLTPQQHPNMIASHFLGRGPSGELAEVDWNDLDMRFCCFKE